MTNQIAGVPATSSGSVDIIQTGSSKQKKPKSDKVSSADKVVCQTVDLPPIDKGYHSNVLKRICLEFHVPATSSRCVDIIQTGSSRSDSNI